MSDGTTILDLLSSFCALFTFPMVMKHSTQMYSKFTRKMMAKQPSNQMSR